MPNIKRCSLKEYDSEETESDDSFVADIEFALPAKNDNVVDDSVVSSYNNNVGDNAWLSELNANASLGNCTSLKKREYGFSELNSNASLGNCTSLKKHENGFSELNSNVSLGKCTSLKKRENGFSELNANASLGKCTSLKKRENGFSNDREVVQKKQCLYRNENGDLVKGYYGCQDFVKGDIVWAKCSKRFPAWPAIVIDPICEAPKTVLMA
ncbi:PWWP domain-containing protein, partial [Tanacetum coccineum]